MKFKETPIKNLYTIELQPNIDDRGFFVRSFCKKELAEIGLNKEIVQVNHSATLQKGSFRGFHFQYPPYAETKIIRCIKGRVLDFAIDIRKNSPTFLQHFSIELSEENFRALYLPEGFAHGFQVLSENSEMLYFHTEFYNKNGEGALNYSDPKLKIELPLEITEISDRDKNHKFISNTFKGII